MAYKFIDTANGPLVQNGDQYVTLTEVQELLGLQEMDPTFMKAMTDFLAERLRMCHITFTSPRSTYCSQLFSRTSYPIIVAGFLVSNRGEFLLGPLDQPKRPHK